MIQADNVPGAGVTGISLLNPFKTILKDGFSSTSCVKDAMYYSGDKFGDNKYDYALAKTSVSIVHYDAHVAKEDRQGMTQKVCFEFCRTVPNMGFFGLVNGRHCYCTPYFKTVASDSSECDVPCEGASSTNCGGKSKSSVFSMHMCASTGKDLQASIKTASDLKKKSDTSVAAAKALAEVMQSDGSSVQGIFGQVGDLGATAAGQALKVAAGKLSGQVKLAEAAATKLAGLKTTAEGLSDFTKAATITKAESTMQAIAEAAAEAQAVYDALDSSTTAIAALAIKDASKQYWPVMSFVDEKSAKVPSSCAGTILNVAGVTPDSCAAACNANPKCVGYQLFDVKTTDTMCVLLSSFESVMYYTGCDKAGSFLQTRQQAGAAPFTATCFAKFSKFQGTSLKPDPSGKCSNCFKKVTNANRCYKHNPTTLAAAQKAVAAAEKAAAEAKKAADAAKAVAKKAEDDAAAEVAAAKKAEDDAEAKKVADEAKKAADEAKKVADEAKRVADEAAQEVADALAVAEEAAKLCKCAVPLLDVKDTSDWWHGKESPKYYDGSGDGNGKSYWRYPGTKDGCNNACGLPKPFSPMKTLGEALHFMDQCTVDDLIAGDDNSEKTGVLGRFGNYVRECGGKTGRSDWGGWPGATKADDDALYKAGNHFGGWNAGQDLAWKTSAYDSLKAELKKAYKAHYNEDYVGSQCQKAAR